MEQYLAEVERKHAKVHKSVNHTLVRNKTELGWQTMSSIVYVNHNGMA